MQQLGKVLTQTSWAQASNTINFNSDIIYDVVSQLENVARKNKGYFASLSSLQYTHPRPENGAQAFVFNSASTDDTDRYLIYDAKNGSWVYSGMSSGAHNAENIASEPISDITTIL